MAHIAATKAIAVVVVAMITIMPMMSIGLSCNNVDLDMLPCLNYIRNGGDVPSDCCNGLNNLANAAQTTDDRRAACDCLKKLASGASNDELDRAAVLPDKCGITLPYKFSPSTDCSKIN